MSRIIRLEATVFHTMDSNREYYRVNKNCYIFSELMTILLKTFIIEV
ncbi:MAG: hypothetical protein SU899_05245 [Chloroflexota bacterium]|nr:hypothetical protein [Chloroflexota bacterium]